MKTQNRTWHPPLVIFYLLVLCSCVSKQPRHEVTGPQAPTQPTMPTTPVPDSTAPVATPSTGSPQGDVSSTPLPSARELRGPVTLVFGGAGVASFATVGVLKKMQEDGVKIESIIATGWPALFSVGFGLMRSVHDLEWFAMKLEQSDFASSGLFSSDRGFSDPDRIQNTLAKTFGNATLNQTRVPIVLSTSNSSTGQSEVFGSGGWLEPLLKAISVPGTFRPYPDGPGLGWVSALSGLDVEEAYRRGAKSIVAISMYDDYLVSLQDSRAADSETLFRNLFGAQLSRSLRAALKRATASAQVRLSRSPTDFSAKRLAIQAGYQEAAKLLRSLSSKN